MLFIIRTPQGDGNDIWGWTDEPEPGVRREYAIVGKLSFLMKFSHSVCRMLLRRMKSEIITWVCANCPRIPVVSVSEKLYTHTRLAE